MKQIILGDNLEVLPTLPNNFARLIYIDSPFSTGKVQQRKRIKVKATDGEGDRTGFAGKQFITTEAEGSSNIYNDKFDDFPAFLMPRIEASLHCLTDNGALFVHLDYREVHYIKVALDKMLGRHRFVNELIWAYDYGARSKSKWPAKHDTILFYAMNPNKGGYVFNFDAMDRIPYLAPGLVGKEKAERGKTPTDVWFKTIVPTMGKEKQNYPTQKPLGVLDRIVKVHSNEGDVVLDFFAGSGSLGQSAENNNRGYVMIDNNPDAVKIMHARLPTAQCIGF